MHKKWKCEYCTFDNWSASKRCTVCRAMRPPQLITDEAPTTDEQDIYKIAPLVRTSPSQEQATSSSPAGPSHSSQPASPRTSPNNKWPCQACTYLNWPKATKCTQCLTPRPKVPMLINTLNQPLSISVQGATANAIDSRNNSPKISPTSPEDAKAINNDRNRAIAASVSGTSLICSNPAAIKWHCQACTYENWPKSMKCVLCGVPKGKQYLDSVTDPIASSSHSPPLSVTAKDSGKRSKRRSPQGASAARNSDSNESLLPPGGAMASISSPSDAQSSEKHDRSKSDDNRAASTTASLPA